MGDHGTKLKPSLNEVYRSMYLNKNDSVTKPELFREYMFSITVNRKRFQKHMKNALIEKIWGYFFLKRLLV